LKNRVLTEPVDIFIQVHAQEQKQPPAKHEFTAQQCVEYASKNNDQVKNAMLDVQVQSKSTGILQVWHTRS
jgi:hypothetical protein